MGNRSPNHKVSAKAWAQRNRKAVSARVRRWQLAHPEQVKRMARNTALKRRFGITIEQYEAMLTSQGGKCKLCRTDKPGGRGTFHVDHDHKTGIIRGLLCQDCNVHKVGTNTLETAKAVVEYLSRPPRSL